MKINLKGTESQRYREIRRVKQLVLMPDKRTPTHRPKIVLCCLTPDSSTKKWKCTPKTRKRLSEILDYHRSTFVFKPF